VIEQVIPGGVGDNPLRPDALAKCLGAVPYPADVALTGMVHAVLVRADRPAAALVEVDVAEALMFPGVHAVLTAADIPGSLGYGSARADRPVLAAGVVRHVGEPVAVVAADDLAGARRAAATVRVVYRDADPVLDVAAAEFGSPVHPDGNVVRTLHVRRGPALPAVDWDDLAQPVPGADLVLEQEFVIGRTASPAGPPGAVAVPTARGLDLITVCRWTHADRDQIALCLNLTPDQIRLVPAIAPGPPDPELSAAVLAGLLALRLGRPVRVSDRGVDPTAPTGPALRARYRHHATTDGALVAVQARLWLDAGAYAGDAAADLGRLCAAAAGPYRVGSVDLDAVAWRTNTAPPGPRRGFAAAAGCVAAEAQLDRVAAALGLDPVAVRLQNALDTADPLPTGQLLTGVPAAGPLLSTVAEAPLPGRRRATAPADLPGGVVGTASNATVRRGVGHAVGFTPLLPGEGQHHEATATVRLTDAMATVRCAAAEHGQGFLTVAMQIVREVLAPVEVELVPVDSDAPSAGPAADSRLTWVAGGAVFAACTGIARALVADLAEAQGISADLLTVRGGRIRSYDGLLDVELASVLAGRAIEQTATYAPPATEALDPAGQGVAFAGFGFAAHRAVVDVDVELGLVRVVELLAAVDVGRVVNLTQIIGVLDGGSTAGLALALGDAASHPTMADTPGTSLADLFVAPQENSWLGVKGVWDTPVGAAAAAIAAAIRAATGAAVTELPVRPWHLVGSERVAP
jgi:CO/xanthine dehydrogenase Mo-binding subunit